MGAEVGKSRSQGRGDAQEGRLFPVRTRPKGSPRWSAHLRSRARNGIVHAARVMGLRVTRVRGSSQPGFLVRIPGGCRSIRLPALLQSLHNLVLGGHFVAEFPEGSRIVLSPAPGKTIGYALHPEFPAKRIMADGRVEELLPRGQFILVPPLVSVSEMLKEES